MSSSPPTTDRLNLRAGEWIEVRGIEEILATLDERHALDGLPFMPEMAQYCGRRFRVGKTAHKTCDTIQSYVIRSLSNAVHLEGLRCDGSAHEGCQARCLIFWKEAWLKRSPHGEQRIGNDHQRSDTSPPTVPAPAWEGLNRSTRRGDIAPGEPRYRCQATDLLKATTTVRRRHRWNPAFYLKDLTSGNVGVRDFVVYGVRAAINAFTRYWFGWRSPRLRGLATEATPTATLNLQPGELVQVRSKDEILKTLTPGMRNRGLWFDVEMVRYCDSRFRVLSRVERIIDEKTGRLMRLPNPCLILEGVVCSGCLSDNRMFCPRAIYPYWREVWLKRVGSECDDPR